MISTTIGLFLGGAAAVDSFVQGNAMSREALIGLEEFEAQQLVNNYEGLSPSLEAELTALRGLSEQTSGFVDVSQGLDASDALALMSTGTEQMGKQRNTINDSMRKEQSNFDVMEAQEEGVIRGMQEQRELREVDSLQNQLAAGQEMRYQATTGLAKQFLSVGLAKENRMAGLGNDKIEARRKRIADGTATSKDLFNEGKYMDYIRSLGGGSEDSEDK